MRNHKQPMKTLKFTKKRNVKSPERGTKRSAGIDFFVPKFTDVFKYDLKSKNPNVSFLDNTSIMLAPSESILIPSGIKLNLMDLGGHLYNEELGVALIAYNKSGVAVKSRLDIGASVVDEDYQGELHIHVVNTSNDIQYISQDQKLVQFLLMPVLLYMPEEVDGFDLFDDESERGTGGFGSTGA